MSDLDRRDFLAALAGLPGIFLLEADHLGLTL